MADYPSLPFDIEDLGDPGFNALTKQRALAANVRQQPALAMPSSGVESQRPTSTRSSYSMSGSGTPGAASETLAKMMERIGKPPETGPLLAYAQQRRDQANQNMMLGLTLSAMGGEAFKPVGAHILTQALKESGDYEVPGGWGTVTPKGVVWNPEKQNEAALSRLQAIYSAQERADTLRETRAQTAAYREGNQSQTQANRAFQQENALRDDFEKQVKDQRLTIATYPQLEASLTSPVPSAASDMRAIFRYMKMLDPTSVVREGEYATAKNAAAIPDRIRNMYNSAAKGLILTPAQRQDFLAQSRSERDTALKFFNERGAEYAHRARTYGLNPNNVIVGYGEPGAPAGGAAAQGRGTANAPISVRRRAPTPQGVVDVEF
jgi:hypothetical protein